ENNERWSWYIRAIVAAANVPAGSPPGATCDAIAKLRTDRPKNVYCEEDGCWSTSNGKPTLQCTGTVAAIGVAGAPPSPDCAPSYPTGDVSSPTGCDDRPPTACDPKGNDRCDGNVKLGCDRNGLVSFHDCALIHATCVQDATGAKCVTNPDAGCTTS